MKIIGAKLSLLFLFASCALALATGGTAQAARLKDIATFEGVRVNQLMGRGLVVGLNGTGDKSSTTFTNQMLANMLKRSGTQVTAGQIKVKNVAAVMITAVLPPFVQPGATIDVLISSLGDASSLQGGTLIATFLTGLDGNIYAVAQGPVSVGGFSASGAAGGGVQKNHPTVGRIVGGATVERAVPLVWNGKDQMSIRLNQPDFTTAQRLAGAVSQALGGQARALNSGTVSFSVPEEYRDNLAPLVASLENLEVRPDTVAKVIIEERTGTIVIGENVSVSTVAVATGSLSIQIKERQLVSQPPPFSGQGAVTTVVPDTEVGVSEEDNKLIVLERSTTIAELVKALNAIGASPRDLIVIFQALKAAGALHAELEII